MPTPRSADLFCRVIDNFGDAGVCWRLARQLAAEHGLRVRLFIDRPEVLARLAFGDGPAAAPAAIRDVEVLHWTDEAFSPGGALAGWRPPDLVIAAFACRLPDACLAAMEAAAVPPAWINLEYLSAEDWVDGVHGLSSPKPDRPLVERFFVPGFGPGTGGLPRERDLMARRLAFEADTRAQADFCRALGIGPRAAGERLVSLFCYPRAPVADLCEALRADGPPTRLLVPPGVATEALRAVRDDARLRVRSIPFLPQPEYDRLLWLCDVNLVRGEDSFVRAQWAGKPMLWHIYVQDDDAHLAKLEAFVRRLVEGADPALADALRDAMRAWNGEGGIASAWTALRPLHDAWAARTAAWRDHLSAAPDLAARLLRMAAGSA